jgi:hypothetical protein
VQNIDVLEGTKILSYINKRTCISLYEYLHLCANIFRLHSFQKIDELSCNRITADAFMCAEVFALSYELH